MTYLNGNVSRPSFGQIKSVKCAGLYNKDKESAAELVRALKENQAAMKFCNEHDADIVFFAHKSGSDTAVESKIIIFFDNIAKSKTAKFFQKLFGKRDNISLSAYMERYDIQESLKGATERLKNYVLPEHLAKGKEGNGILDSHIKYVEAEIKEALEKKEEKNRLNDAIKELKESTKTKAKADEADLNDAINDLLNG